MKKLVLFAGLAILFSCSHQGKKVIRTLEDRSKPAWIKNFNMKSFTEGSKKFFVGVSEHEFTTDINVSDLFELSDLNARAELSKFINSDTNVKVSQKSGGMIGEDVKIERSLHSSSSLKNSKVVSRWFEIYDEVIGESKQRKIKLYSLLEVKNRDIAKNFVSK